MMLKSSLNYGFFSLYLSKSTFLLIKSEKIEIKDAVLDKTKIKNCNHFSPFQHGMACCALMHSATYITFSQSGSFLHVQGCGSLLEVAL